MVEELKQSPTSFVGTPPTRSGKRFIGLIGNPNCGKTTLFNALTGSHQKVGNWPGVTVEKKMGRFIHQHRKIEIIDLPGLYSLDTVDAAVSLDEQVARDYMLSGEPDAIINIIDASNIERNLFLTTQLLEMRVPVIVVLNMMDVAQERGIELDPDALAKQLGCPVFSVIASQKKGLAELIDYLAQTDSFPVSSQLPVYPAPIVQAVEKLLPLIRTTAENKTYNTQWLSLKALEGDYASQQLLSDEQQHLLQQIREQAEQELEEEVDIITADARYAFIGEIVRSTTKQRHVTSQTTSDKIDRIVLNRFLGIPIFLLMMYLMFLFTINVGGLFNDFFEEITAVFFVQGLAHLLTSINAPEWLKVILTDGMGGGISTVASFIPIIGFMFIFLSFLEDSGYMARAAFVMDRFMRIIGLPGKSFVPLIVGFGCNVPAVMATRTLESHRDRLMTIAMAPFMSCGARLPIFALFAIVFFSSGGQNIVFLLYLLGLVAAVLTGLALKYTLLPGKGAPFIMELPPYHIPTLKSIAVHTWENLKGFVVRAGKVIVPMVMVLNIMNSIGTDGSFGHEDTEESILSYTGKTIAPAFAPIGLTPENWPASVGIFTGLLAKEAVVGTLSALYEQEANTLNDETEDEEPFSLWAGITAAFATIPEKLGEFGSSLLDPLGVNAASEDEDVLATPKDVMADLFGSTTAAFAYLILILLYFPCFAVIGAIAREAGTRWAIFVALWTSAFAYCAATLFYQTATFSAHPLYSGTWIAGILVFIAAILYVLRMIGKKSQNTLSSASNLHQKTASHT